MVDNNEGRAKRDRSPDYYEGQRYTIHGHPFSRSVFAQLRNVDALYYHTEDQCEDFDCFCGNYGWKLEIDEKSIPILKAAGFKVGTRAELQAILEAEARAKAEAKAFADALRQAFEGQDDTPPGEHLILEGEEFHMKGRGQNIYGGGSWYVITTDGIWCVRNNGADGDDWSRNNIRTGGAGAIGRRFAKTPEREALVRKLVPGKHD